MSVDEAVLNYAKACEACRVAYEAVPEHIRHLLILPNLYHDPVWRKADAMARMWGELSEAGRIDVDTLREAVA